MTVRLVDAWQLLDSAAGEPVFADPATLGLRPAPDWPADGALVPARLGWEFWLIVDGDEVVGDVGTKSPYGAASLEPVVEIGYHVVASRRRRGLGTAGVAACVALLAGRPGLDVVVAEVATDNVASLRLLARVGFGPDDVPAGRPGHRRLALRTDALRRMPRPDPARSPA